MHEASLVSALLRQVDALAAEHAPAQVDEVQVEVGPLSGVEPQLFYEAFERLKPGTSAARATLTIDTVSLTCRCGDCLLEYTRETLVFECPACRGKRVSVVRGDGVLLVSIAVTRSAEVLA